MTPNDIQFLEDLGLEWPPPDRIATGLVIPADLDSRIAAHDDEDSDPPAQRAV